MKTLAKQALVQAVGRLAPVTWPLRAPASLLVLMYHRVLPTCSPARLLEQPGMYVSPETLDLHLSALKGYFQLVHLDDWLRRVRMGKPVPRLASAITFDDGWRDNFDFALPVLEKHAAPATIFLVSSYIGSARQFWPNRLTRLLYRAFSEPGSIAFPPALRGIVDPVLADAAGTAALLPELADRAIQAAKKLDEQAIRDLLDSVEQPCIEPHETRELLNAEEIVRMASTDLIRFGSHTATHFRLGGNASAPDLEHEIVFSRRQLGELCGQSIDLFCYPNGETSPAAIDLVRRHYLGAVTTRKGWHGAAADPHLACRIGVHDDVSSTRRSFLARISGWA